LSWETNNDEIAVLCASQVQTNMGERFNSEANKARQKESVYRKLYSFLLQRNRSVFQGISKENNNGGDDVFEDEMKQLASVFQTEVMNLSVGIGVAFTAFAALRFGPKFVLQRFGGQQRAQALREAEEQAKKRGTEDVQKSIGMKK
jgi:hypothetical protein